MSSKPPAKGDRRPVRIGKYEVISRLASGGRGSVYRAKDVELGREVALKILPADVAAKPGMLERFRQETRQAAALRHENIVTLYECGEANGTYFLALELVAGGDLNEYIKHKGPLEPATACQIAVQAARALDYLHKQGQPHGHLRSSSFLLVRRDGPPQIKLADVGPALEAADSKRAAAFLAPEQVQDHSAGDARSDIYALGCVFFQMLSGRLLGPEADFDELRTLNPRVNESVTAVLRHMLAKRPDDRYQTPTALLHDLGKLAPPAPRSSASAATPSASPIVETNVLAGLVDEDAAAKVQMLDVDDEPQPVGEDDDLPDEAVATPPAQAKPRSKDLPNARIRPAISSSTRTLLIAGGVLLGAPLLVGLVVLLSGAFGGTRRKDTDRQAVATTPTEVAPPPSTERKDDTTLHTTEPVKKAPDPVPPKPQWPALYQPKRPLDLDQLRKDFAGPFATPFATTAGAPVYHVTRVIVQSKKGQGSGVKGLENKPETKPDAKPETKPDTKSDKKPETKSETKSDTKPDTKSDKKPEPKPEANAEKIYESVAAAAQAAPAGQLTIIKIDDNGPLFEPPIAVSGRSLMIEAGEGYHPLLVWDVQAQKDKPKAEPLAAFLSVTHGNLLLGNIDVGLSWSDPPADSVCLVHVTGGELLAWNSIFSVATRHRNGVAAVRFDGTDTGKRCRLSHCFLRGSNLVALDVHAPGAELMIDSCLCAGGEPPLLQVDARKATPSTLRLIRSTLVANQTLLQLRPDPGAPIGAPLHCMAWDALLARSSLDAGGTLIDLPPTATSEGIEWRAINCLYAGWKTLLSGQQPLASADEAGWRERWHLPEGDKAISNPWTLVVRNETAEEPPSTYFTGQMPLLGYTATFGNGLLGADLLTPNALPPAYDNWLARTYERAMIPEVEVLADNAAPPIPTANDGKYYGQRIDVTKVDLGAHLRDVAKKQPFGTRVVLHLYGSGEARTSAIFVQNSTLVLWFEPVAEGAKPLVLVPDLKTLPKDQEGVIQVDGGDLELIGADIRCPDFKTALLLHYLIGVRGGNLRVHKSRLQGPMSQPPNSYWGLIYLWGSGQSLKGMVRGFTLNESLLLSGRIGIHVLGIGWCGRLQDSLIVSGLEALHFQPGTCPDRLNVQCSLEHVTVASRRSVVYLEDTRHLPTVAEPIVLQTKACAFLNPFAGPDGKGSHQAGMLLAEDFAQRRGLLMWQGDGDVYDKRLQYYALTPGPGGALPVLDEPQPHAVWARLWGAFGDRQPLLDVPLKNTLELDKLQLEHLELPAHPSIKATAPGANFVKLGIVKKK